MISLQKLLGREASTVGLRPSGVTFRAEPGKSKQITMPVTVTDEIMAGVISMPHGWGHDAPNARLSYARTRPGINSNVIASEFDIDVPSGNAVLTGFTVGVVRATLPDGVSG